MRLLRQREPMELAHHFIHKDRFWRPPPWDPQNTAGWEFPQRRDLLQARGRLGRTRILKLLTYHIQDFWVAKSARGYVRVVVGVT